MDYSDNGATAHDLDSAVIVPGDFAAAYGEALTMMQDGIEAAADPVPAAAPVPVVPGFTVDGAALRHHLKAFGRVADKRNTIPVLTMMHAAAIGPDKVRLTATDLDSVLSVDLPAERANGAGLIPVHSLAKWIGTRKGTFGATFPGNAARVSLGSLSATFDTVDLTDFPHGDSVIQGFVPSASLTMPLASFYRGLSRASLAMATETTRYYLNGVYFHPGRPESTLPPVLRFIATDGHRLVEATEPMPADAAAEWVARDDSLCEAARILTEATERAHRAIADAAKSRHLSDDLKAATEAEAAAGEEALREDHSDAWRSYDLVLNRLTGARARLRAAMAANPMMDDPAAMDAAKAAAIEAEEAAKAAHKSAADAAAMWPAVIFARPAVELLLRMIDKARLKAGRAVKIEWSDKVTRFTLGDTVLTAKNIDGTFPDYRRVIPGGPFHRLTVDRPAMMEAAAAAAKISAGLRIEVQRGGVQASTFSASDGGAMHADVPCEPWAADDLSVGFTASYLHDFLDICTGGDVAICFSEELSAPDRASPGSPVVIEREGMRLVLMPRRA